MDGSKIGVFEEGNQVGFSSLLESHDSRGLETEIGLGVMMNTLYKSIESAKLTLKS